MENLFLHLLNLSITASYIVLAVILLRLILSKAPKWISCLLWAVVGLRLAIPFSIESIFSLIPSKEPIPNDIMISPEPQIHSGISFVNSSVNPIISESFAPVSTESANPMQVFFFVATVVWAIGLCATLLWGSISYLRLKRVVSASINLRENIYLCDEIDSPFILGIIRPRIYLPSSLGEEEAHHVIAHERAHLARKDHFWKPIGFLLLAIYWFNPILWLAYVLLCRDIEAACDQRAISDMSEEERKNYSGALLSCSSRRFAVSACPLAFGEVGVKSRIKSVLNYKKPAFWIIIVSLILCVVLAVCFLTMPKDSGRDNETETEDNADYGITDPNVLSYEQQYLKDKYPEYFGLDASEGLDIYVCQFSPGTYYFYLFEHSDTMTNWIDMSSMKGCVSTASMRLILDTYDVTREDITVIPFQHMLSSYIGPHMIISKDEAPEDTAARRNAYKEKILDMLFGYEQYTLPIYDSMQFDVDGDGNIEHCVLGFGRTSGIFTFAFTASEVTVGDLWEQEYYNVIYSDWYKLSFVKCDDGVVRVQGIDQTEEIHLFDISIVDGNVQLTEDGVPIGKVFNVIKSKYSLLYSEPSLSWVLNSDEVPFVEIAGEKLYTSEQISNDMPVHTQLGTVTETTTEQNDFKALKESYGGRYAELVDEILENNQIIYKVDPLDKSGVSLYYVMFQKDGSRLLVYGHYEGGEKNDFIRWIFRLGI